jgi:hypothetical protein
MFLQRIRLRLSQGICDEFPAQRIRNNPGKLNTAERVLARSGNAIGNKLCTCCLCFRGLRDGFLRLGLRGKKRGQQGNRCCNYNHAEK